MVVRISELPHAEMPDENEFLAPVFLDHTDHVTKQVKLSDLVEKIKQLVLDGSEVEMIEVENGVKFRRLK